MSSAGGCGDEPEASPDQRQLVAEMREAVSRARSKRRVYEAAVRILETEEP